ncbi:MAG: biotin/lipoyl-binding protein [Azonexus sp.]|uniref:efflux RND transporter periplasmic adaptor subunit n=1 Tax=Azonexus sp. TaxID=1872668 RepID=UPI002822E7AD|nr:HlyD family efflux transporter periplasmic adaptor subunit [Azonexus sp.]MDR0776773.1 biotin/lipoyl-binding protein [Azonexus sp.]
MTQVDPAGLWPVYASLQRQALEAPDIAALSFVVANETWHLVPYQQACVCLVDHLGRLQVQTVSGLVSVHESTLFTQWVQKVCAHRLDACPPRGGSLAQPFMAEEGVPTPLLPERRRSRLAQPFTAADLPADLAASWQEWWPAHALCLPLDTLRGVRVGALLLTAEQPWTDAQRHWLQLLRDTYAHAFAHLRGRSLRWRTRWQRWKQQPRRLLWLTAGVLALLLLPVRTSVLAPAEIIALQAEAVTVPIDGVVKTFHVEPNRKVQAGDLLVSLDDTTLRNRLAVATEALAVAKADELAAQQKAFDQTQSRADLATLQGRVRERSAELAHLKESMQRLEVRASHDGVFVYSDPNDWLGKPVMTGERLGQLAQPDDLGVLVWLPVADAINLEEGADMRVFLQAHPLSALSATLKQTSYQASLSPEGVASYHIRGRLTGGKAEHIGLRGVAKVYGDRYPLIYWMFRRPLGTLRQWVGV